MYDNQHNDLFGHGYDQVGCLSGGLTEKEIANLQRKHSAFFNPETVVHSDPLGFGYSTER